MTKSPPTPLHHPKPPVAKRSVYIDTADIIRIEEMTGGRAAPPRAAARMRDGPALLAIQPSCAEFKDIPIHIVKTPGVDKVFRQ